MVEMTSGIGQGTCVAALLFLIFINDLPETVTRSFMGLFCDDALIAKEVSSDSDSVELQNDLNEIQEWTEKWGMTFNQSKCVVMTVTNKRKPNFNTYYLSNMLPVQCLTRSDCIKYLGVTIDNKLTFTRHIEAKCTSARKVLNMLRRNLHFAPASVKAKAYMTCVRPIVEYASASWAPSSQKHTRAIEMIQNSAAKFVLNSYPKKNKYDEFSVTRLIEQLGWHSLETRRNQARLIMTYKILNNLVILPPSTLPRAQKHRNPRKCNEVKVGVNNQLLEPHSLLTNNKTFFYVAPRLWNKTVTEEQAEAPSCEAFKRYFGN